MKTLLFLSFLLASLFSWSQVIYGSLSGGYQFGVGKQNLEHHSVSDIIDSYSPWHWQQVDLSLGKGVQTNFTVGYDFKQHYGVSLSGSYLFGAEFSSKTTSASGLTYERKLSANMLRINPSFRMYVGENRCRTYAEIGFILGIGKINLTNSVNVTDIIFVDHLDSDPTIVVVPNEPVVRAKHSYPFHSYGLSIGVKYILWEKKKEVSSEI